jgi:hypothetical protein
VASSLELALHQCLALLSGQALELLGQRGQLFAASDHLGRLRYPIEGLVQRLVLGIVTKPVERAVANDRVQPGSQADVRVAIREGGVRAGQRLLDHVLGAIVPHDRAREPDEGSAVAPHDLVEGRSPPLSSQAHQAGVRLATHGCGAEPAAPVVAMRFQTHCQPRLLALTARPGSGRAIADRRLGYGSGAGSVQARDS